MGWSHDDPLDPARGCFNGLILSTPFWLVIGLIILSVVKH